MHEAVAELISADALDRRFGYLASFDRVVIAVSGGGDSTALMRLVQRWAKNCQFNLDQIDVATVDHGLRPESREEAAKVGCDANSLGLHHTTLVWQGDKPDQGVQNAAREARYQLLCELAGDRDGRSIIVTAHTRDDQAETVLMRLARGSGPDGLAAIPSLSKVGGAALYRPLLDVAHATLIAFLEAEQANWLEDPMNEEPAFERIRVRQAREARKALHLDDAALARTAERMARARRALEAAVDDAVQRLCAAQPELRFGCFLWSDACRDLPDDIAIRLLRRVVHLVGGQAEQPQLGQIEEIYLQLMSAHFTGGTLSGVRFTVTPGGGGAVVLWREIGRTALPEAIWQGDTPLVWDRRFRLCCTGPGSANAVRVTALSDGILSEFDISRDLTVPAGLPRDVMWTLPVIMNGDHPISVPTLGLNRDGVRFEARFLQNRLISEIRVSGNV